MNIAKRVLESADLYPDHIAIKQADDQIHYADLSKLIKSMSHFLVEKNVNPTDRIVIFSEKSITVTALLIATLAVGAVYVPIDILYSLEHAVNIIKDSEPSLIFCTSLYFDEISKLCDCDDVIDIDHFNPNESLENFILKDSEMACILYTSGSTGHPKGVCLSHHNIFYFSDWCINRFQFKRNLNFANHAPFTFDLSLFDIFCSLSIGATLHLLSYPFNTMPSQVLHYLISNKINVWYSVPYFLTLLCCYEEFNDANYNALEFIFYAGESYPIKHLKKLRERFKSAAIFNFYGPTETNVCAYWQIPEIVDTKEHTVPIGIPTCDTVVTVMKEDDELCVQGKTVAMGYWKKGDFKGHFKTGDIVSMNESNQLVFLGRKSHAIQYNQKVIYPEVIESILNKNPYINSCVLFYRFSLDDNLKKFFIVIQAEENYESKISKALITELLNESDYSNCFDEIILTKKIIRTKNGKINRDEKSFLTYLKKKK